MLRKLMSITLVIIFPIGLIACTSNSPDIVPTTDTSVYFVTTTERSETEVTTTTSIVTTKPTTVTTTTKTTVQSTTRSMKPTTKPNYTISTTTPTEPLPEIDPGFTGEIVAYSLWPDEYAAFLQNPTHTFLRENNWKSQTITKPGERWRPWVSGSIEITKELFNLVTNTDTLSDFLYENDIVDIPQSVAMFNAWDVYAFWVKTDKQNVFITINEDISEVQSDGEPVVLRVYTEQSYYEAFQPMKYRLIVNGKDITNENCVHLYKNGLRDTRVVLPTMPTLLELGAKITWSTPTSFSFRFGKDDIIIDLSRESIIDATEHDTYFTLIGTIPFWYVYGGEFLMEHNNIKHVLCRATDTWGQATDDWCVIDEENLTVTINFPVQN